MYFCVCVYAQLIDDNRKKEIIAKRSGFWQDLNCSKNEKFVRLDFFSICPLANEVTMKKLLMKKLMEFLFESKISGTIYHESYRFVSTNGSYWNCRLKFYYIYMYYGTIQYTNIEI